MKFSLVQKWLLKDKIDMIYKFKNCTSDLNFERPSYLFYAIMSGAGGLPPL